MAAAAVPAPEVPGIKNRAIELMRENFIDVFRQYLVANGEPNNYEKLMKTSPVYMCDYFERCDFEENMSDHELSFLTNEQKDEFLNLFITFMMDKIKKQFMPTDDLVSGADDIDGSPIRPGDSIMKMAESSATGSSLVLEYRERPHDVIDEIKTSLDSLFRTEGRDSIILIEREAAPPLGDNESGTMKHVFQNIIMMLDTWEHKITSREVVWHVRESFSGTVMPMVMPYLIIGAITLTTQKVREGRGTNEDKMFMRDMVFSGALYDAKFLELYPE